MEPVQPAEFSARLLSAVLDHAHSYVGAERTRAALARAGVTESYLRGPGNWVSLRTFEAVLNELVEETRDEHFVAAASRLMFQGDYLGALRLFVQFGPISGCYRGFPKNSARWDKVGRWSVRSHQPCGVTLLYESPSERSSHMCTGRLAQLQALPGLWGLPPARIEHPTCIHRGDDHCTYEVEWAEASSPSRRVLPSAVALGSATGFGVVAFGGPVAVALGLAVVVVLGHLAVALFLHQSRALQLRTHQLIEHHEALERVVQSNEARYADLRKAHRALSASADALEVALAKAKDASAAKSRFLATMSHELRTPVNAILGYTELVMEELEGSDLHRDLDCVVRSSRHLLRLIDDVLDISRVEHGLPLCPTPTDLAALVEEAIELVRPDAMAKGLATSTSVSSAVIMVDSKRLLQVVLNLLSNAIKFTETGRIEVSSDWEPGGHIVLAVEDTGIGIALEDQPKIFGRFFQIDGSSTRNSDGAGLGLAVSYAIAQAMGGELRVESRGRGTGSRFEVRLPASCGANAA